MGNDVFFETCNDGPMKVQEGFAFLNFSYSKGDVSQAATFFVIAAILHNMRTGKKTPRLGQHSFVRKVLSPRCFDRFNDGAIQASILRAAFPSEIDYSTSPELSKEMRSIIEVILNHANNQVGEAAREFMIAIGTERLQLCTDDLIKVLDQCDRCNADPFVKQLGSFIRVGLLG